MILPVNGTREGLFSFVQAVVARTRAAVGAHARRANHGHGVVAVAVTVGVGVEWVCLADVDLADLRRQLHGRQLGRVEAGDIAQAQQRPVLEAVTEDLLERCQLGPAG